MLLKRYEYINKGYENMLIIALLILSIIAFSIHMIFIRKSISKKTLIEFSLSYMLFFLVGLKLIIVFLAHVLFPYSTADILAWEGNSTFQFEVGISNLAIGSLAILCIWIRMKHFWMATIIATSIFLWGSAIGHIIQMITASNFSSGNAGFYFYSDIIIPIIIIWLYIWLLKTKKETNPL